MKKLWRTAGVVALAAMAFFAVSCSDDDDDSSSSSSSSKDYGSGTVVGYVLDNKGSPVQGATVTLANNTATTNAGGEFEITGVSSNDSTNTYSVTVKKDGYIPTTVTGIEVTYSETLTDETAKKVAELEALQATYKSILEEYAKNAASASTEVTSVSGGAAAVTSSTKEGTVDAATMKEIATALTEIQDFFEELDYKTDWNSTFAAATLVPLDASLKGTVKINTKAKAAATLSEATATTARPTIKAVYTPATAGTAPYAYETTAANDGTFSFTKLPSGVNLSLEVEGFAVGNAWYSTDSADLILDGSSADLNSVNLEGNVSNTSAYVIQLYAQNDKIIVTDTNVASSTAANLLDPAAALTFSFSKAMSKVTLTAPNLKDVADDLYTVVLSDDAKTATITPKDGAWTTTGDVTITVGGEATDGVTTFVNNEFTAYFNDKIYASLQTTSFDSDSGRVALNTPVVIEFSKAIKNVSVRATGASNSFTQSFDTDSKVLTLTPVNNYWTLSSGNSVAFTVEGTAQDGTSTFAYWKDNSDSTSGLTVYFDNIVDVSLADTSSSTQESFTITFSKELRSFDTEDNTNVSIVNDSSTAVTDFTSSIDSTKKVVTIAAKNGVFATSGTYTVTLTGIEAVDGSKSLREYGKSAVSTSNKFTADFEYAGLELEPSAIEIVSSLPASATKSRAAIKDITADKYVKVTFNKSIYKSALNAYVGSASNATSTSYIDGADVYVPLYELKSVGDSLVLGGSVTAADGTTYTVSSSDIEKLLDGTDYKVYAALTVTGTSLLESKTDISGTTTYSAADPIVPGAAVTFTFSSDLTDDTASYEFTDADGETVTGTAAISGNTVTITDDALTSNISNDASYSIKLVIKNGDVVLFSTANSYFPSSDEDVEAALASNSIASVSSDTITVKVAKTAIVASTEKDSKTTSLKDFQKSYKSDIVLQFTVPAKDFKIVLATVSNTSSDDYDEFVEDNEDSILASTTALSKTVYENDTVAITSTNYFVPNENVYVSVFDSEGEYLLGTSYTAANVASDFVAELAKDSAVAKELTVVTDAAKIGNGASVVVSVPASLSSDNELPEYALYVLNSESKSWSSVGSSAYYDKNLATAANATYYRLYSPSTAYMSTTLSSNAFGFGGNVQLALVEVKDGVSTVYTATLADKLAPSISSVTYKVGGNTSTATVTDGAAELAGTGATTDTGVDITVSVSAAEYLSSVTVNGTEASYSDSTASCTVKGAKAGETITVVAKDVSGNAATVTLTVKD